MRTSKWFIMASCSTILGILMASCAPAAQPTPTSKAVAPPAATATTIAPSQPKPAAPAPTPKPAAEAPRYGGIVTISGYADPPSLDVHQESSVATYSNIDNFYDALIRRDPLEESARVPGLAKSWEVSQDGLTYTFRLQEGVKWHDGTPFTAQDVKFSLERQKNPPQDVRSMHTPFVEPVKSIDAVDANTVRIQLSRIYPPFITVASFSKMAVMPKHILEKDQTALRRSAIGTGPFKFKGYQRGIKLDGMRNPDYFKKGLPYVDGFVYYVIPDAVARGAAFRTGRVMLDVLSHEPAILNQIEATMKDRAAIYRIPYGTAYHLIWNSRNPVFQDKRVRQALNFAIDRYEIEAFDPGMLQHALYMSPVGAWAFSEEELSKMPGYAKGAAKEAEREQARKLVAEAGYGPARPIQGELLGRAGAYTAQGVYIKSELQKVGIDARISVVERAAWDDRLYRGDFFMAHIALGSDVDDPDMVFPITFTTGAPRNYGGYSNAEFDELSRQQSQTLDVAKRRETVLKMQRMLHEDGARVALGFLLRNMAVDKRIRNFKLFADAVPSGYHKWEYAWLAE
ncbi:MAG: ABC transporter substrate-binding protein [Chloroflexi bacterium]|nr:ABC transporter substrate-binding protein [Chloroflexota bacterium]